MPGHAVKLCRVLKPMPSVLRANTVPAPELPPYPVVPYRVLPDKIKPPNGLAPSLLVQGMPGHAVKLCRLLKPVPSVLRANTVPAPELPPYPVVPYRVLPDKIKPPNGLAPSLLVPTIEIKPEVAVKLCSVVKPVPSVL